MLCLRMQYCAGCITLPNGTVDSIRQTTDAAVLAPAVSVLHLGVKLGRRVGHDLIRTRQRRSGYAASPRGQAADAEGTSLVINQYRHRPPLALVCNLPPCLMARIASELL
jgi:hypothetical protein